MQQAPVLCHTLSWSVRNFLVERNSVCHWQSVEGSSICGNDALLTILGMHLKANPSPLKAKGRRQVFPEIWLLSGTLKMFQEA